MTHKHHQASTSSSPASTLTLCWLLTSIHLLNAQILTFGGPGYDYATLLPTSNNGYLATGTITLTTLHENIYIARFNPHDSLLWIYAFTDSVNSRGHALLQTPSGHFFIAGSAWLTGLNTDIYILKLDTQGQRIWTRGFGGTGNEDPTSIILTPDGNLLIAGSTHSFGMGLSDIYILKLDTNGNLLWARTIGDSNPDWGNAMIATSQGGYVIAGTTFSYGHGGTDILVIYLDSTANIQWARAIGGIAREDAYALVEASDHTGFVIVGTTNSFGQGEEDVFVVKVGTDGSLHWAYAIGGPSVDVGLDITRTADGGYILVGRTRSFSPGFQTEKAYIVKLDANGNIRWSRILGEAGSELANTIRQTPSGTLLIAGQTYATGQGNGDIFIARLPASGNLAVPSQCPLQGTTTVTSEQTPGGNILIIDSIPVADVTALTTITNPTTESTMDISSIARTFCPALTFTSSPKNNLPAPSTIYITQNGTLFLTPAHPYNLNPPISILITDLTGKILIQKTLTTPTHQPLGKLNSPGIYVAKVQTAYQTWQTLLAYPGTTKP